MNFPYSDEYMTYDYKTHRYVLTKKCMLEKYNENLQVKFKNEKDVEPFLRQVSTEIYSYIHSHNINTKMQDYILAKTESGREIIQEAMEQQALYMLTVGIISRSLDPTHRALRIDETANDTLLRDIPEIGTTILYAGNLCYRSCDNSEW